MHRWSCKLIIASNQEAYDVSCSIIGNNFNYLVNIVIARLLHYKGLFSSLKLVVICGVMLWDYELFPNCFSLSGFSIHWWLLPKSVLILRIAKWLADILCKEEPFLFPISFFFSLHTFLRQLWYLGFLLIKYIKIYHDHILFDAQTVSNFASGSSSSPLGHGLISLSGTTGCLKFTCTFLLPWT